MDKRAENIYYSSPIWLQNILISIYGLKLYFQRYGRDYKKAFLFYSKKDYSNLEKELEIQQTELQKLVKYAFANSEYYQKLYTGIDLSKIKTVEDLKLLPIVEKEDFRKNLENIYTLKEAESIPSFTGGTTGKSLKVLYEKKDFQKRMAYLDAFKARLGIDTFKAKKATFSGREFINSSKSRKAKFFWRYNWIYKQKLYSTFDLTDENMPLYLEDLNKFKPEVLNGFVSALYELAKYIDRNNIDLEFTPKAIFTTSESLLPVHRTLIERIFNTRIYNQYASAEGAPFITECKKGNLHYNLDTGVIEVIRTEYGDEILVSSFTTYGTPLIRYRIGDSIKFLEGTCPCGSCHPLVGSIEGRQVDYLFSIERGKISLSHLADVIKGMPNSIINMQFVQDKEDTITINLVIDQELFVKEEETMILKEMNFRFGIKTRIIFNYVNQIQREKSGKFSLIKNNLIKKKKE